MIATSEAAGSAPPPNPVTPIDAHSDAGRRIEGSACEKSNPCGSRTSTAAGSPQHRIARATPGFSGSDLRELCRQAAYCPVREMLREELPGPPRPLQEADFVACIPTASPTRDAARSYHRRHAAAASSSAAASGADGIPAVDIASLIEAHAVAQALQFAA